MVTLRSNCAIAGATPVEALATLDAVMEDWLESELEQGHDIPEPLEIQEYSGEMMLRISPSVHRDVKRAAEYEGVSINQWVGDAIAERLGGVSTLDRFLERIARHSPDDVARILKVVGGGSVRESGLAR